ncbi:iron-containing alcohol dehydrogenase [Conexibacter arvalis]|uniref:Alcohol dehydrogenase class IV n=1 Tax=Conexibacter arvalis TaxID=912552 RepID=A0A840I8R9_9ACTN|nr:iron-containing alcohol dehydrogenase [Conexibacter arvalis]MBB4661287.1 alcohol dehydrogenase class IV [Conexibacter arvalis]
MAAAGFRHDEAQRSIVFGRGAVGEPATAELLGEGYALLTTSRAADALPALAERAARIVDVPHGKVDVVAGDLLASGVEPRLEERLVALGGGRVIDVAKALAAAGAVAGRPRAVAAIPTTLSGAEMTGGHRHARGVDPSAPRVRPSLVVNDPALSASHAVPELAASSANALGHVLIALASARTTPFARAVAREAAVQLAAGWVGDAGAGRSPAAPSRAGADPDRDVAAPGGRQTDPDRDAVALGALLAGWAVDESGLGLQHVLAQTAVRIAGAGHAEANAALLPATAAAVRRRAPAVLEPLDALLGIRFEELAARLRSRAGASLGRLADDDELLEAVVAAAGRRADELQRIAPAPDGDELRALYRAAAGPT